MDTVPFFPRTKLWKNKADFFRPFRLGTSAVGENITPLFDPETHRAEPEEDELQDLNTALGVLIDVFPDVEPEVFREMLLSISVESRLQVVTEHLLTKKAKWVSGRYRTPQDTTSTNVPRPRNTQSANFPESHLADEATFRSEGYKTAVKQVLYQEFGNLRHSAIKAVLAEQNFSYTLSRPVLQQLSSRTWRFSLSNLWSKRTPSSSASELPFVIWRALGSESQLTPAIKRTGSSRLDRELYDLFVGPVLENQRQTQLTGDRKLALRLNENEAEEADALFDCECCYSSVTFEQMTTCDDGCHHLCFECVRRTVSEALFGQGWSRTVDLERSTVKCFASTDSACIGVIPGSILRRALARDIGRDDMWNDFQERAAGESLLKSRLPLQRCPFCNYTEIDEIPQPQCRKPMLVWLHIVHRTSATVQIMLLACLTALIVFTIPLILLASVIYLAYSIYSPFQTALTSSWARVYKRRRGLKFNCRHPDCSATSCVRCLSYWRDPHACFENEKTSLRTAIESSATAAIKRTCPKCFLSFVKSSGCNKLVCNCGYTMCYICRQEITSKEGYSHFCQHFRPHGGRCVECERCDLYGDEDEESAIREAAEAAERAWMEREKGQDGGDRVAAQAMVKAVVDGTRVQRRWEMVLDAIIDAVCA